MARKVTFLLALLLLAVLASSAAAAEPFARHTVRGHGVSLAVPRSWVAADSRVPGPLLERLARENPRLAPFLRQLGRPTSPTKFFAFDPVVRDGFATNVNVVVTPLPSGLGFQDYGAALAAELRSIGARNLRQGVAVVDGERAARLQYRFDLTLGGARLTVQTLQYAFPRSGRSTVVTYTTLPSFAGRYAATFRRSAASIRFS